MRPFRSLIAVAAPLGWRDVNTDIIFPMLAAGPAARRSGDLLDDRDAIARNCFGAHRWLDDGSPDPAFILNTSPFDQAEILVAGSNFGCGSSREAAVWSLVGIGVRCIIAPSFGDIFHGNCVKNGLLPATLPFDDVERLLDALVDSTRPEVRVDLESTSITGPDGIDKSFSIGSYARQLLLDGIDEIDWTTRRHQAIDEFEQRYSASHPWLAR